MISWEYLAGFFDGEGNICSLIQPGGLPTVVVCISQANEELLQVIQAQTGGSIGVTKDIEGKKKCFQLHINRKGDIITFLRGIRPFVLRRAQEIDVALVMTEAVGGPGGVSTEKEKLIRLRLHAVLKELQAKEKRRGVVELVIPPLEEEEVG